MFPWGKFPFNKDSMNMMNSMKPDEINKYIQSIMGQVFPNPMEQMFTKNTQEQPAQPSASTSQLQAAVFETHDYVYVRVEMKQEDWLKKMRLYHTSNQMIIEHIPAHENKHTITLPALVKKKGATAQVKDQILEIKIPKNIDMQYSEIDVDEIL